MSGPLTPSQTVGPFFGVGLPFERGEQIATPGSAGGIRIEGRLRELVETGEIAVAQAVVR